MERQDVERWVGGDGNDFASLNRQHDDLSSDGSEHGALLGGEAGGGGSGSERLGFFQRAIARLTGGRSGGADEELISMGEPGRGRSPSRFSVATGATATTLQANTEDASSLADTDDDSNEMEIVGVGEVRGKRRVGWRAPAACGCLLLVAAAVYTAVVAAVIASAGGALDIDYAGGADLELSCDTNYAGGNFRFKNAGKSESMGLALRHSAFYFASTDGGEEWGRLDVDVSRFGGGGVPLKEAAAGVRLEGNIVPLDVPGLQAFINAYLSWRINNTTRPEIHLRVDGSVSSSYLPFSLPINKRTVLSSPHTSTYFDVTAADVTFGDGAMRLDTTVRADGFYVFNEGLPMVFDIEGAAAGGKSSLLASVTTHVSGSGVKGLTLASTAAQGASISALFAASAANATDTSAAAAAAAATGGTYTLRGVTGPCLPQKVLGGIALEVSVATLRKKVAAAAGSGAAAFPWQLVFRSGVFGSVEEQERAGVTRNAFRFSADAAVQKARNETLCTESNKKHLCVCKPNEDDNGKTCTWRSIDPHRTDPKDYYKITDYDCRLSCGGEDLPVQVGGADAGVSFSLASAPERPVAAVSLSSNSLVPLSSLGVDVDTYAGFDAAVLTPLMNRLAHPALCVSGTNGWLRSVLGNGTACLAGSDGGTSGVWQMLLAGQLAMVDRHVSAVDESSLLLRLSQALPDPSPEIRLGYPLALQLKVPNVTFSASSLQGCVGPPDHMWAHFQYTSSPLPDGFFFLTLETNVSTADPAATGVQDVLAGHPRDFPVSGTFTPTFTYNFNLSVPPWTGLLLNTHAAANPFPIDFTLKKGSAVQLASTEPLAPPRHFLVSEDAHIARHVLSEKADDGSFTPKLSPIVLEAARSTADSTAVLSIGCPSTIKTLKADFTACLCGEVPSPDVCAMPLPADTCEGMNATAGVTTLYELCPKNCAWCKSLAGGDPTINLSHGLSIW
eukprot:Rhum_TRINITY_DN14800_c12_g1::Rhum_TRINITY_DN14800_c12_g1_i1::g.121286::m.121286